MKHLLIEGDPTHWTPDKMLARLEREAVDTITIIWFGDGYMGMAVLARGDPSRVRVGRWRLNGAASQL